MKKFAFVVLLICSSLVFAQDEEDTVTTNIAPSMFGFGIQGGPTIISPEYINNQIEFVNEATNSSMTPIRSSALWSVWFSVRPKNVFNYVSFRAERMSNERAYTSTTQQTDNNGNVIGSLETSVKTNYTLYPLSLNVGAVIPKTATKFEIGLVYAFSYVDEEGNLNTGQDYTKTVSGEGYGLRAALQFMFPLQDKLGATFDIGYRFLQIEDFRDDRGNTLKDFVADYSGIICSIGISYGM